MGTLTLLPRPRPQELSEGYLLNTNEESSCDETEEDAPEEVCWQNTSHKRTSQRSFMTLKAQRIKMI